MFVDEWTGGCCDVLAVLCVNLRNLRSSWPRIGERELRVASKIEDGIDFGHGHGTGTGDGYDTRHCTFRLAGVCYLLTGFQETPLKWICDEEPDEVR